MMRSQIDGNILTIFPGDRIDTSNAPAVEAELMEIVDAVSGKSIVVDAEELEYISSAGLRVIMKLRKKSVDTLTIINVSSEVLDVFEITGFTQILNIKKKIKNLDVEGLELIGQGGNGKVYRLDDDKIVKIYEGQGKDLVEREQKYAKTALINGIPSVIPYNVVRSGENYGVVFELIKSDTLGHAIASAPDKMMELIDKYVELAKTLHSTHLEKGSIPDVRDLMRERADNLGRWCTEDEVKVLHEIIDAMPEVDTVIHNDLHPGNIMIQDDELVLIDMAEVTVGPKALDLSSIFRDMIAGAHTDEAMTEKTIGMPVDMVEQVAQIFFSKYTGITDPDQMKAYFDQLTLIFALNTVLLAGSGIGSAEEHADDIMNHLLRPVVIPNKDVIPQLMRTL